VRAQEEDTAAFRSQPGASRAAAADAGNQSRVRLQKPQTESITGTSTRTPTTVARVAPDVSPNNEIAVATAGATAPVGARLGQRGPSRLGLTLYVAGAFDCANLPGRPHPSWAATLTPLRDRQSGRQSGGSADGRAASREPRLLAGEPKMT
jgi:hypothetical protein